MPFADLINKLITDSTMSLPLFSPELAIVITIVALLLSRLCNTERFVSGSSLALIGLDLAGHCLDLCPSPLQSRNAAS